MLRHRADTTLSRATTALTGVQALAPVREVLDSARRVLAEPMRVALAGRVSSGKSTLANALIGGDLLGTGPTALTYTVTELRYAEQPALTIHYRDGRPAQRRPLDHLSAFTARDDGSAVADVVDHVVVDCEFPYLRSFHLIDTPGLESPFVEDTAAAMRTVRITAEELQADAVVLVVARGLASSDRSLLAEVQGASFGVSPITTVGVLTKVELFWPDFDDPLAEGRRVANLLMEAADARRMLYEIRPACSLVGAAAEAFTEEEFEDLLQLAKLEPRSLERRIAHAPFFTRREYPDMPTPANRRAALFHRFGGYGITLATRLIRDGVQATDDLRDALADRSGLADLRKLLLNHFGNRRDLIKLRRVIDQVRALPMRLDAHLAGPERVALADAVAEVERLALNEHAFQELTVLQHHYDGRLGLSAQQVTELLRVTGEHGQHITARLGLPAQASVAEMAEHARHRLAYWSQTAADPTADGGSREVARLLQRSYERILHHVERARLHLEMAL